MKTIIGNIFDHVDKLDVIVHGCNCFATMGAGIAAQIARLYPEAYIVDSKDPRTPEQKLGGISFTKNTTPIIINAYTQFRLGRDLKYNALENTMHLISLNFHDLRIGMPMIGAGIAGGDWEIIEKIISKELVGMDVTIFKLN